MAGQCWNCGRDNSGDKCYSCGFEVIHRAYEENECSCDPAACSHGNFSKCDKCLDYTHLEMLNFHEGDKKEYCDLCYQAITHAEKYGKSIDIWEAKNVE
jgi:hypothetical protein